MDSCDYAQKVTFCKLAISCAWCITDDKPFGYVVVSVKYVNIVKNIITITTVPTTVDFRQTYPYKPYNYIVTNIINITTVTTIIIFTIVTFVPTVITVATVTVNCQPSLLHSFKCGFIIKI